MPMPIQSSSAIPEMLEKAMMATLSSAAAAGAAWAARTGPDAGSESPCHARPPQPSTPRAAGSSQR